MKIPHKIGLKMVVILCGFVFGLILLTGTIQLVKQDYRNWLMATEEEFDVEIEVVLEEKVPTWLLRRIVEVTCNIYTANTGTSKPIKCPRIWLEQLYLQVNVGRWADPLNVAVIVTVLSLMSYYVAFRILIGGKEDQNEEMNGSREASDENQGRKSEEDVQESLEDSERFTEDELVKEEQQNLENMKEEEEESHREKLRDNEETQESISQESVVENELQFIKFEKLFNEWRHGEALDVLQNLQLSNDQVKIWKAKCLVKMKRKEDARQLLCEHLKKDKENTSVLTELGFLYLLMEDVEDSRACFEKVLELSSLEDDDAIREKAMVGLRSIEKPPKRPLIDWDYWALMILAFTNAIIEKKRLYFFGMANARKGHYFQAKMYFDEVMQRGGYRMAWTRRAFCCLALGEIGDALQSFRQLSQQNGMFVEVVDLAERIVQMVDGECPYRVLSISEKATDIMMKKAFAQVISDALSDEEKMKIRKAYARLSDYAFKLQYDALRNEILKFSPS